MYACVRGSDVAASIVQCTPSASTLYVSGSTVIVGVESLHFMSFFPMLRQPLTAAVRFLSPYEGTTPVAKRQEGRSAARPRQQCTIRGKLTAVEGELRDESVGIESGNAREAAPHRSRDHGLHGGDRLFGTKLIISFSGSLNLPSSQLTALASPI